MCIQLSVSLSMGARIEMIQVTKRQCVESGMSERHEQRKKECKREVRHQMNGLSDVGGVLYVSYMIRMNRVK